VADRREAKEYSLQRCKVLAASRAVEQMTELIGADSQPTFSINGFYGASDAGNRNNDAPPFCDTALSNDYPIPVRDFSRIGSRRLSLPTESRWNSFRTQPNRSRSLSE
jgi:hypothetical protein